jgi:hypothetical protein
MKLLIMHKQQQQQQQKKKRSQVCLTRQAATAAGAAAAAAAVTYIIQNEAGRIRMSQNYVQNSSNLETSLDEYVWDFNHKKINL